MRAAVYLRISQDRAGTELGVTRQREDCEALVERRGWTLHDVYVDNDVSAKGDKVRPEWERLMADLEAGKIEVVVGWTIDRTLRSGRDRLRMLESGKQHGITIAIVRGSDMDLSTPAGRFAADMLGAVALNEIEVKADRQRRAAEQAAAMGKAPAGPRAFGFTQDRSALVPAEATAIRAAYAGVLAGTKLAEIARRWNAQGLRSSRHKPTEPPRWSAETVKALLIKPRNAALRTHRDREVGPAQWPAIVPEETFRAAVAILTDPARLQSPPTRARYLLSGVARCGVCGETVQAGTRQTYHTYRCRTLGHVARRGDYVDALIEGGTIEGRHTPGIVVQLLSRPDARDLLIDHQQPDIDELRDQAQALRSRLDSLATEFAEGELTPSQLRTATVRLRSKLATVEQELADAGRVDILGDLITAEDVAEAWKALDTDRKRAVVDLLMTIKLLPAGQGARTFDPTTVEITPKV